MTEMPLSRDKFFSILDTTLSTLNIDKILTTVVREIRVILGAQACTLYLIDKENNELSSKVLEANNLKEIRVPLAKNSLAGYAAITVTTLNIKDAYDVAELKGIDPELDFDRRWDEKSGHRTTSVLATPIKAKGEIVGVFQALNKPGGFTDSDLNIMEQLTFVLGIAVNNALSYLAIGEEKKFRQYIIDDIEEGICILDTQKQIISGNKFLEVMSGMRYPVGSMVGKPFFEIFPQLKDAQLEEKINEVFRDGFKKMALLEVLETKIIPYLDDRGRVKRVILIFTKV